ncbi:chorismate lyase [Aquabacterium commune]|uniref:Probable chorismate pyruvate-lyase n=1 Tax=Aquabacterium commune TaxID=70586 RepID=A0A4V3CWW9_9BURK|nr:chorismate lyase [Aquabacterium commune]TDP87978.1 chorismate lyase [Aquabacterium commune]
MPRSPATTTATAVATITTASADLRRWLGAPGSLTARLRLNGAVTVDVLAQGRMALLPQERQALGCQAAHVREVLLRIDGRAAVWARSVTPLSAVKGPWAAIEGLGTRPLAELLFSHRRVLRGPLQASHLRPGSPLQRRMARAWWVQAQPLTSTLPPDALPRWARHSLFWHRGQPLQVLEAFAPWMLPLPSERR